MKYSKQIKKKKLKTVKGDEKEINEWKNERSRNERDKRNKGKERENEKRKNRQTDRQIDRKKLKTEIKK